jgi:hypothetical protein
MQLGPRSVDGSFTLCNVFSAAPHLIGAETAPFGFAMFVVTQKPLSACARRSRIIPRRVKRSTSH